MGPLKRQIWPAGESSRWLAVYLLACVLVARQSTCNCQEQDGLSAAGLIGERPLEFAPADNQSATLQQFDYPNLGELADEQEERAAFGAQNEARLLWRRQVFLGAESPAADYDSYRPLEYLSTALPLALAPELAAELQPTTPDPFARRLAAAAAGQPASPADQQQQQHQSQEHQQQQQQHNSSSNRNSAPNSRRSRRASSIT